MLETWVIILVHLIVFQGMFITKNITLGKKINKKLRGKNIEATISIIYFSFIIVVALTISILNLPFGNIQLLQDSIALITGLVLLVFSLIISAASLVNLGDSWRVGVLEDQETTLVTTGIYRFTRNPYFVSYLLMFAGYTVLLQNIILLGLSIVAFIFVHNMILKEENYLLAAHSEDFSNYMKKVSRYLFI